MNQKIKILYIDDDIINIELFEIVFSDSYIIYTGIDGKQGIDLLSENQGIDVVISDMKMPGMNGLEFIELAKKKYPDKLYFLLTGYGINNEIQDAIKNGLIINCLSKPFNKELIDAEINKALILLMLNKK